MDCAKVAGARTVRRDLPVRKMSGMLKIHKKLPLLLAVPTTAGTGSEVTLAAVITDETCHYKHAIMDYCLIPRYAFLDPGLSGSLPPDMTAYSGMDALTHAVEAYVSVHSTTKETDRCAEEATAAIFRYLERAYANGHDLEARQEMLLASFKAGVAFTRAGVGNVHADCPYARRGCIIRRTDWQTLSFSPSFGGLRRSGGGKACLPCRDHRHEKRPAPRMRRARRSSPRSAP